MNIKKINWILVILGLLLALYGFLCLSTLVTNSYHKDFAFLYIILGCAILAWGIYVGKLKEAKNSDKLMVYNTPGKLRILLSCILSVFFALLTLFVTWSLLLGNIGNPDITYIGGQSYILGGIFPYWFGVVMGLILMPIGGISAVLMGYMTMKKIPVTPLLAISEKNPTYWNQEEGSFILYANFGFILGSILRSLVGRNNFILCDEGMVIYKIWGPMLIRWNKFTSYTANRSSSEFKLRFNTRTIGTLPERSFFSKQKFDEVNHIVSEHIPSSLN